MRWSPERYLETLLLSIPDVIMGEINIRLRVVRIHVQFLLVQVNNESIIQHQKVSFTAIAGITSW